MRTQPRLISLLVVVRNERDHIARCLESLLTQDYPPEAYEIIVVDGMSDDGTREIIAERIAANPERPIRLLDNPRKILSSGWNIGIREAFGEYVVRPDAHAELTPTFLKDQMRAMSEHPHSAAVGGMVETVGKGFVGEAIAAALSSRFGVGGSRFRTGGKAGEADTAVFGLYQRQVLLQVGGFDESVRRNQDVACHSRLRSAGLRFYFDPSIRSRYYCRNSIRKLAAQMFGNGCWLLLLSKHRIGCVFSLRYFVPMGFVLALIVLGVLSGFFNWARWMLLAMLAVYFAGAVTAAMAAPIRLSQKAIFPLITLVMHVSYGLGWLAGLLKLPFHRPAPAAERSPASASPSTISTNSR